MKKLILPLVLLILGVGGGVGAGLALKSPPEEMDMLTENPCGDATGGREAVFSHEPRLRDAFLQVMFDHANIGGFNGAFTSTANMRLLREALQEAADRIMNGHISDVLIVDIVRQDVTN